MKKLLFALAVLFCPNLYAQEVTGCLGLKFGDNLATVKSVMASKSNFKLSNQASTGISYINGYYGPHECVGVAFQIHNNKLHTIKVLLYVKNAPKVMDLYYEVVTELQDKYGVTPEYMHSYKPPYEANDGYTSTAIANGFADIGCIFRFPNDRVVTVTITEFLSIKVTYQDAFLAKDAIREAEENNQKDY